MRYCCLSFMLPTMGFNQSINGIIRVFVFWLDYLAFKENCLLSIIMDMSNISYRIVGVVEVLKTA